MIKQWILDKRSPMTKISQQLVSDRTQCRRRGQKWLWQWAHGERWLERWRRRWWEILMCSWCSHPAPPGNRPSQSRPTENVFFRNVGLSEKYRPRCIPSPSNHNSNFPLSTPSWKKELAIAEVKSLEKQIRYYFGDLLGEVVKKMYILQSGWP